MFPEKTRVEDTNGNKYFSCIYHPDWASNGSKGVWGPQAQDSTCHNESLQPALPNFTPAGCQPCSGKATATIDVRHPRLLPRAPEIPGSKEKTFNHVWRAGVSKPFVLTFQR